MTGATDGIGKAAARTFIARGYAVGIIGRDRTRVEATAAELRSSNADVTAITADLSIMSEVRRACNEFTSHHDRLDVLILNANAIAQSRTLTVEGHERNFALGFLSRVLTAMELQGLCAATPKSQMLTVVGLNQSPVDFDDLTMAAGFSGQRALGTWQWAMQVWAREFNERQPVPMNIFMPGIVRTKILDDEPGRVQRVMVGAAKALIGVDPEQSARQLLSCVDQVRAKGLRDTYFSRGRVKGPRVLKASTVDGQRVWELANSLLADPPLHNDTHPA